MAPLRAITFDLWDTLVADDSDEAERARRGLRSKRDERRHLLFEALDAAGGADRGRVDLAFDVADAAFNRVWREHHITWTLPERLDVILTGLGRSLPEPDRMRLIEQLASMEVEMPPDLIEGCDAVLAQLSAQYPLAVVSDAIVTPGRMLRELLERHGVKQFFSSFAFSDEVGHSKPHRSMFQHVADELGVELAQMLHIGDREHNDVRGAHALGMRAILFAATRDDDAEGTQADGVCRSYAELPAVIEALKG
jgi:putative hydrolase of the HAD superfamily